MAEITGRDRYVIAQALAYAITAMEALPEHLQEHRDDMVEIFHAYCTDARLRRDIVDGVERRLGRRPNLIMEVTNEGKGV